LYDKAPLYSTFAAFAVLLAFLLLVQPYSGRSGPPSRWDEYARPAQRFLKAASQRDSLELSRQSVSSAAARWGLAAARRYPDSLAVWAREARVWSGFMRGDTVEVLFTTDSNVCEERPIWIRFLGDSGEPKVVEAGSTCFEFFTPRVMPPPHPRGWLAKPGRS
jgi:hypothetical protein